MQHARVVSYDDGTDTERFALIKSDGGDVLDLLVWDGNSFQEKRDVPRRESGDVETDGGGHTWHQRK